MSWTEVLKRVAPSVVGMEVPGRDGLPFRCPGVVLDPRGTAAWGALQEAPARFSSLSEVAVRQGARTWTGSVDVYLEDWAACAVSMAEPFDLPVVAGRRSVTLEKGEELAVVDCPEGEPVLLTIARLHSPEWLVPSANRPFEQSLLWFAQLDPPMHVAGRLAFDASGRFAGILDPPFDGNAESLNPAESFTNLISVPFFSMLFDRRQYQQLAKDFERWEHRFADPEPFCLGGMAFEALGQLDRAIAVWRQALAFDPANPWTLEAIGQALTKLGRTADAAQWLERARAARGSTDRL